MEQRIDYKHVHEVISLNIKTSNTVQCSGGKGWPWYLCECTFDPSPYKNDKIKRKHCLMSLPFPDVWMDWHIPCSSIRFSSGAFWGRIKTLCSLSPSSGCFWAVFVVGARLIVLLREPLSVRGADVVGDFSVRLFGQMVGVKRCPHERGDPEFPSRTWHCGKRVDVPHVFISHPHLVFI